MSGRGAGQSSSRVATIAVISGVSLAALFFIMRRILSKPRIPGGKRNGTAAEAVTRPEALASQLRHTQSDRGVVLPPSSSSRVPRIRHSTLTGTVPPLEADLVMGLETCQELIRNLERANANLSLVKNRSDKDRNRSEMVQSTLDRLRVLETDINRLVLEGGSALADGDDVSMGSGYLTHSYPKAGTLSVLSDDSFMSALEELPPALDDEVGEDLQLDQAQLHFYHLGLEKATAGEVTYRKARTEWCQCESETEFAAKVFCLRQALEMALSDEHRRLWLAKSGRQLLGSILKHSKQDPTAFFKEFDSMIDFIGDEKNMEVMREELEVRGVTSVSFWDIVLDFILLDSFDDLKAPPSAIFSVTRNYFLSQSMKYSTISTIIWSMLKKKRQRLQHADGFIAHFYNISEAVSPAITLGFLGTEDNVKEMCIYFKDQISCFVLDIFNSRRVRYTSLEDLAEDVWIQLETRAENVLARMNSEPLPA